MRPQTGTPRPRRTTAQKQICNRTTPGGAQKPRANARKRGVHQARPKHFLKARANVSLSGPSVCRCSALCPPLLFWCALYLRPQHHTCVAASAIIFLKSQEATVCARVSLPRAEVVPLNFDLCSQVLWEPSSVLWAMALWVVMLFGGFDLFLVVESKSGGRGKKGSNVVLFRIVMLFGGFVPLLRGGGEVRRAEEKRLKRRTV